MNLKPLLVFLLVGYVGLWLGGILLDYITPLAPDLFTGVVGDILQFSIPMAVFFFGWHKFGKKG